MARKPQNKEELLNAVDREWTLLLKAVGRLSEAQLHTPDSGGWSPKDNLAHLDEWMKILLGYHIDRRPGHKVLGVPAEVTRVWELEKINRILYERNKDRPYAQVMTGLKRTYGRLVKRLEAAPFEDWLKPRREDDPRKAPLLNWVLGDTTEHFREHRLTILKGVREG